MAKYKLTYFHGNGRAEVARLLFALANQDFEDVRLDREKEWPEFKPTTPFGQVPILEVDGQLLSQGRAISRFLAKRFGYAGKTDWEEARVDMIADCLEDWITPCIQSGRTNRPEVKDEIKEKFFSEHSPRFLANLEKFLEENGSGYFVGEEMTWADLSFSEMVTWPGYFWPEVKLDLAKYPRCQAVKKLVESHPAIAAWVAKRPAKT